ncbi:MAG: hypothetical protein ACJAY8_001348 [Sphingobacteriales bacterium]|jgi:hypothetical protein
MVNWNDETAAICLLAERGLFKEHAVPMYATSTYVFEDAE